MVARIGVSDVVVDCMIILVQCANRLCGISSLEFVCALRSITLPKRSADSDSNTINRLGLRPNSALNQPYTRYQTLRCFYKQVSVLMASSNCSINSTLILAAANGLQLRIPEPRNFTSNPFLTSPAIAHLAPENLSAVLVQSSLLIVFALFNPMNGFGCLYQYCLRLS